jgi:hypothetical protein
VEKSVNFKKFVLGFKREYLIEESIVKHDREIKLRSLKKFESEPPHGGDIPCGFKSCILHDGRYGL